MEYFSRIVSDALLWETIKWVGLRAIGALLMTAASQYLLTNIWGQLKERRQIIAFWIGMPILLIIFILISVSSNDQRPDLLASVQAVMVLPSSPADKILMIVAILNKGMMPSIATSWKMTVVHEGQLIKCTVSNMPEKIDITIPAMGQFPYRNITYYSKDLLPVKALTPIPPGGMVTGLLLCQLNNIEVRDFKREDKFEISFDDVFLQTHTAYIQGTSTVSDAEYIPGITQDIK
jgi:hypothetical protein